MEHHPVCLADLSIYSTYNKGGGNQASDWPDPKPKVNLIFGHQFGKFNLSEGCALK